jgi:hypothetical protein
MMHPRTYVAQTTCAHINHFYRCVLEAMEFDGPALISCYTTCQPEHGVADNMATDQARLAVDTRAFPLIIYDPRKGDTIREHMSLQGNPAINDDWWTNPKTGDQVDFIDFARSEGRFVKHFDKDGNPSETLLRAKQDRLENWHILQELAGVRGVKKETPAKKPAEAPAKANGANGSNGHGPKNGAAGSSLSVGSRIKYKDGGGWTSGVIESLDPPVLALDDKSKIRTTADIFAAAVAEGIVVQN